MRGFIFLLLITAASTPSYGHQSSNSYLVLDFSDHGFSGQWDIALRDLDTAIGLDINDDSKITWGELKHSHVNITQYALSRLTISRAHTRCDTQPISNKVNNHNNSAYAVIQFAIHCPADQGELTLKYTLFSDLDSRHQGLLKTIQPQTTQLTVLSATNNELTLSTAPPRIFTLVTSFLDQGASHLLTGIDHLLFLISLLLPVVLLRNANQWNTNISFSQTAVEVLKITTAFTLAHALTLCLVVFELISLPTPLIESLIALSVIIAASNNIYPFMTNQRWQFAFAFGLVHGFGFANVLQGLNLSTLHTVVALLSFNLGVEIAQLAIAAAFLPIAYYLRTYRFYQRGLLPFGGLSVMIIALIWLIERSLDLDIRGF